MAVTLSVMSLCPPGQRDAQTDWAVSCAPETDAGETTQNCPTFVSEGLSLVETFTPVFFFSLCAQECAKRIAKVSADAKLDIDEETYMNQFKPHLMDVIFAWANGATFAQICKMTDVFEGGSLCAGASSWPMSRGGR